MALIANAAVRSGYKQTEVGVIPEDWLVTTVGELAEVKTGPFGSALHEKDYVMSGTPIITVEHLGERGVIHANLPMVSDEDKSRLKAYSLRNGDVVFSRVGSVDRNALIRLAEDGWLFSGRLLRVRLKNSNMDASYLSYHFHSEAFKQRVRDVAVGQTMPSLNTQILRGVMTVVPPSILEQQAIAEALSDADALIEGLEVLIAKKRQLKQGAMQDLLTGNKRLLGFDANWEYKEIGSFAACTAGGTPSTLTPNYWGGAIRWMNSGELNLKIVREVEGRITENGLQNSSAKILPKNCVLIGLAGQGRTRGTVAINEIELCTNQSIAAILPSRSFSSKYLYHNLDNRYKELRELSTGDGGRGGLNLKIIKALDIPFPALEEQIAIATVLSDMDAEIAALKAKSAKARKVKEGMMQDLLTGRVRLV